jgi:hypothetical protein
MRGEGGWKRLWSSPWRAAIFAVGGAVAGVVYYELVGCRTGTCALTSSAWRSALFFGLAATVAGFPERRPATGREPGAGPDAAR